MGVVLGAASSRIDNTWKQLRGNSFQKVYPIPRLIFQAGRRCGRQKKKKVRSFGRLRNSFRRRDAVVCLDEASSNRRFLQYDVSVGTAESKRTATDLRFSKATRRQINSVRTNLNVQRIKGDARIRNSKMNRRRDFFLSEDQSRFYYARYAGSAFGVTKFDLTEPT